MVPAIIRENVQGAVLVQGPAQEGFPPELAVWGEVVIQVEGIACGEEGLDQVAAQLGSWEFSVRLVGRWCGILIKRVT